MAKKIVKKIKKTKKTLKDVLTAPARAKQKLLDALRGKK